MLPLPCPTLNLIANAVMATKKCCQKFAQFFLFSILIVITKSQAQFSGWADYMKEWENDIHSGRMYPFGEMFFDITHAMNFGFDAFVNFELPYLGRRFSHIWVDHTGHLELSRNTTSAIYTPKGPLTKWPNQRYPKQPDPPFISPYFAQFEVRPADPGRIFWRRLDVSEDATNARKEVTYGMLGKLSAEVRAQVLGAEKFEATVGLIVTWYELTFYGCIVQPSIHCKRNTIQTAVVTDEESTFVINNYYSLEWVGGLLQNCDPLTGTRTGQSSNCFPAQAGFNAGEARYFMPLPFSNTDKVLDLATSSGTGIPGRFVYSVSGEFPVRGGCTNDTTIDPLEWPLEVYPRVGHMMGGYPLFISGPCFLPQHKITCIIENQQVDGMIPPGDSGTRVRCVVPPLTRVGQVSVQVSLDGGNTYDNRLQKPLPIVPYHRVKKAIKLDNRDGRWFTRTPRFLQFHWHPLDLTDYWERPPWSNTTDHMMINIYLYGYFERFNSTRGEWRKLHTLEEDAKNMGFHEIVVEDHQCTLDCDWGVPQPVGFIKIVRLDMQDGEQINRSIMSGPFPLAWYTNNYLEERIGKDWPDQLCEEWYEKERQDFEWNKDLTPCPTTLYHAHADIGRFSFVEGIECNETDEVCPADIDDRIIGAECEDGKPCPKWYCYREIMSNVHGSISQCCYNRENGTLEYSGDIPAGSPSLKFDPDGPPPWPPGPIPPPIEPHPNVPSLSHWVWDSMFKVFCCAYTSENKYCIDHHDKARPTSDIEPYRPPRYAIAYGDPHFETFDQTVYTFNGRGEFWLVSVRNMAIDGDNFNLQARLEQPEKQSWGDVNATVITSVVMQEGTNPKDSYPKVEFMVNYEDARKQIVTLVDGLVKDFGLPELMVQEFKDVTSGRRVVITCNDSPVNIIQSNFTVAFESGVGVQVSSKNRVLHVIAVMTPVYFGKTYGLFGHWNGDKKVDLVAPSGDVMDPGEGNEYIHHQFGKKWETLEPHSRFTYRASLTYDWYRDPGFEPNWGVPSIPPGSWLTEEEVSRLCDDNFVCQYDYKTTHNSGLAAMTLEMEQWMKELENITKPVPSCGRLHVDNSIRVFDHYLAGGTVVFLSCEDGFTLRGHTSYACVEQGDGSAHWVPVPNTECKSNYEIGQERSRLATLIAVPICLVAVLAALVIAGVIIYRKKKQKRSQASYPKATNTRPISFHNVDQNFQRVPKDNVEKDSSPQPTMTQGLAGQGEMFGAASEISSGRTTPDTVTGHVSSFTNPTAIADDGKSLSHSSVQQSTPAVPPKMFTSQNGQSPPFSLSTPTYQPYSGIDNQMAVNDDEGWNTRKISRSLPSLQTPESRTQHALNPSSKWSSRGSLNHSIGQELKLKPFLVTADDTGV